MGPRGYFYTSVIAALLAVGCGGVQVARHPADLPLLYYNAQYDFKFWLPVGWHGHSVLNQQWEADTHSPGVVERGPVVVLRHRLWKAEDPYQDIPVLVFSRHQWEGMHKGSFFVGAGGLWEEISHNSDYVFAISSRFNANDVVKGWKETSNAVERNRAINTPHLYAE